MRAAKDSGVRQIMKGERHGDRRRICNPFYGGLLFWFGPDLFL